MLMVYTLRYREFGKTYEITIEAREITEAVSKAKRFCEEYVIFCATLYTKTGNCVII